MGKIQEMENFAASLGVKMAVVQVKLGESNKEAWNRHLKENPSDASVMIKIFNQLVPYGLQPVPPPKVKSQLWRIDSRI